MPLGNRHADRIAETLAEWTGCGLDAGRLEIFRMPRRERAELTKALDLIDRHRLVAEEIEQRIDQHRAMACGEHKAAAVRPFGIGGVELPGAREQHGRNVGWAPPEGGKGGFGL